tara:strand:- start:683 stop:1021 length:339 start_codon:yes stop_codon:yes gene_type:complete
MTKDNKKDAYILVKLGYGNTLVLPYSPKNWEAAGMLIKESTLVNTCWAKDPRTNVPAMYFVEGSATASILEVDHGVDFIFEDYDTAKNCCDPEEKVEEDKEVVVGHALADVD